MNEQDPETTNTEFRKVQLSDLDAVINIYQSITKTLAADKTIVNFGLPLNVAIQNNELVGFAAAWIDETDKVKLRSYFTETFDHSAIESRLEEQAKSILYATFENIEEDHSSLKDSIDQLTGWLNNYSV